MLIAAEREKLSTGALLVLQMAYASTARTIYSDPWAFEAVGLGREAEVTALEELERLAILNPGKSEGEIRPTERGWGLIGQLWPNGQIPGPEGRQIVIGSFDGEEDLPVRLSVPISDVVDVLPPDSPFISEIVSQGIRCNAWQLLWPSTREPESRLLVRVARGESEISETSIPPETRRRMFVDPGTWLSVDQSGECRESRSSLEALLFLIAMGAG